MIRLKEIYQGKLTNEQPILPGNYADDDEGLFGLADYLVANGHAVHISEDEAIVTEAFQIEAEKQLEAEQLQREAELLENANRNRADHDEAVQSSRGRKNR
jgi:hypothetical protein